MKSVRVILIGALLLTTACATGWRKAQSSGFMGCDEDDIQISKEKSSMTLGGTSQSWIAECNGRKFFCSETNNGMIGGQHTNCVKAEQ